MAATFISADGGRPLFSLLSFQPGKWMRFLAVFPVVVFRFMTLCMAAGGKSFAKCFTMGHQHWIACIDASSTAFSPICESRFFWIESCCRLQNGVIGTKSCSLSHSPPVLMNTVGVVVYSSCSVSVQYIHAMCWHIYDVCSGLLQGFCPLSTSFGDQ